MNQSQRNALKKLVESRIDRLASDYRQRERDIVEKIREELNAEIEAKYSDQIKELKDQANQLFLGAKHLERLEAPLKRAGFTIDHNAPSFSRYGVYESLDFEIEPYGRHQEISAEVNKRWEAYKVEHNVQPCDFARLREDLTEEILLDAVGDGEGASFLARIPSLDSALPLPS